jgi:hypothetical protein
MQAPQIKNPSMKRRKKTICQTEGVQYSSNDKLVK